MFDSEFADADDAAVVAAIEEHTRLAAVADARRLAATAELERRRVVRGAERETWVFDGWAGAAAEVGAAMTVGQRRASAQMHIAVALRDRLPRVAALYMQGLISSRIVATITWRTTLVEDPEAMALIDAAIADHAGKWGRLSDDRLDQAVDVWVAQFDPDALRNSESAVRSRDFVIGDMDDPAGVVSVWGRILATDAKTAKKRIADMVEAVCEDDPRRAGERRADAVGAILAGRDVLDCRCGRENCAAAGRRPSSNVVIHVVADQSAVEAASKPKPGAATPAGTAVLLGGDVLPTPVLAEVVRGGAKVKPILVPDAEPEPHYRPSARLAEFVRMRDMFCRAPGCDVPADRCELDHTIPYPFGPTHASNIKCLCPTNHLGKTFDDWQDIQLADGTVIWISPSGQKYITKPGSTLFFPTWDITTADLPPPIVILTSNGDRTAMMPRRRRTRAADEAARIQAERARNQRQLPF